MATSIRVKSITTPAALMTPAVTAAAASPERLSARFSICSFPPGSLLIAPFTRAWIDGGRSFTSSGTPPPSRRARATEPAPVTTSSPILMPSHNVGVARNAPTMKVISAAASVGRFPRRRVRRSNMG